MLIALEKMANFTEISVDVMETESRSGVLVCKRCCLNSGETLTHCAVTIHVDNSGAYWEQFQQHCSNTFTY